MNIEDKRLLSARSGKLTPHREGVFLRCHQQSLFTLVHTVYPDIKILGRAVKKLKGQLVYDGGFPQRVLHTCCLRVWRPRGARRLAVMCWSRARIRRGWRHYRRHQRCVPVPVVSLW